MADKQVWSATGRRKQAVANVRINSGSGKILVNGKVNTIFLNTHKNTLFVISFGEKLF